MLIYQTKKMEELLEKSQLKHFIIALAQNLYNRRKHFGPNFSIDLDELQLFRDKVFDFYEFRKLIKDSLIHKGLFIPYGS